MTVKSLSMIRDEDLPHSAFYAQFKLPTLVVGNEYKQAAGTWHEKTYKIIFIGEGVALGICTASKEMGNLPVGEKKLFHADAMREGFVYHDDRSIYRLSTI